MNKVIKITLSDEDERFIKWMAKRDQVTFQDELRQIFFTELNALKDLHMEEMEEEK